MSFLFESTRTVASNYFTAKSEFAHTDFAAASCGKGIAPMDDQPAFQVKGRPDKQRCLPLVDKATV